MGLDVDCRPSDSPHIEMVWRSPSSPEIPSYTESRMTSVATSHCELVIWEQYGRVNVAVRGPESRATPAAIPQDATFFGITFALGTSMPHIPVGLLVDAEVEIPDVSARSFWLAGSSWHLPDYDNAELFVQRMVREGVLTSDPVVDAALRGAPPEMSERTLQRRFLAATGLSRDAVRQIDRAREAAVLIREGVAARDVVHRLGYFDQPHLARSLTRFIGRTATQLHTKVPAEPLSLLYKT